MTAVHDKSATSRPSEYPESRNQNPVDDKAHIRDALNLENVEWRRAGPADQGDGVGVEFAFAPHTDGLTYVAIRQSSQPEGDILIFTPTEWVAFTEGVKDNEFDWD